MYRTTLLNRLVKKINAKSYLEIGVCGGVNFTRINCPEKVGVDPGPNPGVSEYHQMTSDEFFAHNKRSFDLVFIDGMHTKEQVIKDFNNSIKTAKVVVLHDCNPTSKEMQIVPQVQTEWTGDVWKAWAAIRKANGGVCVVGDYGLGVVFVDKDTRPVGRGVEIDYETMDADRGNILGLITDDELSTRDYDTGIHLLNG